jgi:hydrogenase maturation protease
VIVIGIGNEVRRDDGAGPTMIRELRDRCPLDVLLVACDGEPARLIDLWTGADLAVVVDAVPPSYGPGHVHEATDLPADAHAHTSCHGLGLVEAAELGRVLDRMPRKLRCYTIEGADFGLGSGLSPSVQRAVTEVAGRIAVLAREVAHRRGQTE